MEMQIGDLVWDSEELGMIIQHVHNPNGFAREFYVIEWYRGTGAITLYCPPKLTQRYRDAYCNAYNQSKTR